MSTAVPEASAASTLKSLLREGATSRDLASYLDALEPAARLAEVLAITGRGIAALYDAVADAPAITMDEFLPETEAGVRIYEGRNSLPTFTRFQKRFVRVEGGVVVGYNHQTWSFVTGPGYFVVDPPNTRRDDFPNELLFDYTQEPPVLPGQEVGWPAYKPNDRGLSRSVYMDMKDYCRRVARGVVVGKAWKNGVDQNAWFTLTLPE